MNSNNEDMREAAGHCSIDTAYCSGDITAPKPGDKMDQQKFSVTSSGKFDSCTVQEWINIIHDNTSPDRFTVLDKVLDGSIGGLGSALENVLNTQRAVPLFEFRNLAMRERVEEAEQAVID